MNIGLTHYLVISSILFSLGIFGLVTRKNAIMVLMGIELILNAANINFVAFGKFGNFNTVLNGQILALFVIVLAAAEAAIALAIVLNLYKNFSTVNVDEIDTLKD